VRLGDPTALWLAAVVVAAIGALVWGAWQWRRTRARLGEASVLAPLLAEVSPLRRRARGWLMILATLGLFVAALRPQWGAHTELARHRGLDVVFALDVSHSMLARDIGPDRLRRAKAEISALAEQLIGNRVGLIAFAGTAFVQCPLTTDLSALRMFLASLDPEAVPQGGTAVAKALAVADRLFAASRDRAAESGRGHAQVLVLITDGEDHEGEVEAVAARLQKRGVRTYAIGIGSELGEPIPIEGENEQIIGYLKDKDGRPVLSRLNLAKLQALAEAAGGQALSGPDVGANLERVAREIDKLEKSEFESRLVVHYRERYQWPLGVGLAALYAGLVLRLRRRPAKEAS